MGRDPNEALQIYIQPLRDAIHCVSVARLGITSPRAPRPNERYEVVLSGFESVRLSSRPQLGIRAGNAIRIREIDPRLSSGRFRIEVVEYLYELRTEDGEILSFHWTPEATDSNLVTFPHVHIGRALVADQRVVRARDFHKVHIPTGRVSLQAVVRLAIMEFGVRPLRSNWAQILEETESAVGR